MSKQNSSLIPHHISTPLSTAQAEELDALYLGIQLARGRAPDEVLNLLANELRTKIVSERGDVDELDLPIPYGSFDELDEDGDGDVLKVFLSHYADCFFKVQKSVSVVELFSRIRLPENLLERRIFAKKHFGINNFGAHPFMEKTYITRPLISIPCYLSDQTFCAELGHILCDIAQQLALIKPDSQAA